MKAKAQKIAEGVYWIGVLDWDLRSYHGYTLDGTTYNAYLVFGKDKTALIDNAYPGKTEEIMARIDDAFEQEGKDVNIDYIIQNHVEKDHSGVLVDLHKRFLKLQYTVGNSCKRIRKTLPCTSRIRFPNCRYWRLIRFRWKNLCIFRCIFTSLARQYVHSISRRWNFIPK